MEHVLNFQGRNVNLFILVGKVIESVQKDKAQIVLLACKTPTGLPETIPVSIDIDRSPWLPSFEPGSMWRFVGHMGCLHSKTEMTTLLLVDQIHRIKHDEQRDGPTATATLDGQPSDGDRPMGQRIRACGSIDPDTAQTRNEDPDSEDPA